MMSIQKSELAAALRKKFPGGPLEVLKILGVDQSVLPVAGGPATGGNTDAQAMRVGLENLIAGMENMPEQAVAKILSYLDSVCLLDEVRDDDPNAARVRELSRDDDPVERVKEFLKSKGVSSADVEKGMMLLGKGADRLPVAYHGSRMGADLALDGLRDLIEACPYEPALRPRARPTSRPAMGSSRADTDSFAKMFPGVDKIGIGAH